MQRRARYLQKIKLTLRLFVWDASVGACLSIALELAIKLLWGWALPSVQFSSIPVRGRHGSFDSEEQP